MRERRYRDYDDVRTRSPPLPRLRNRERDYSPPHPLPPPRRSRREYSPPPPGRGGDYHDEEFGIRSYPRPRYAMDSPPFREMSRRGSDMTMSRELSPRVYRHRERSPRRGFDELLPVESLVPSNSSLITGIKRQMMEVGDDVGGGRDGSLDSRRHVEFKDRYGTGSRDKIRQSRAEGPPFYGDFSLSEGKLSVEASRIGIERLYRETEVFDSRSIPVPSPVANRERGRVLPESNAGVPDQYAYAERTYPMHSINLRREKPLSFSNLPGVEGELYIEESKPNIHLEKDSSYGGMSTQSKAVVPDSLAHVRDGYHRLSRDAPPSVMEGFSRIEGMVADGVDRAKYVEMPPRRSYAEERMLPEDHLHSRQTNLSPADNMVAGHRYSAELENKRIHVGGQLNTLSYEGIKSIREKYGICDPVGSKFAYRGLERNDHSDGLQRELISGSRELELDYGYSLAEPSHSRGQEEVIGVTSSRLDYGIKTDLDGDELKIREAHGLERDVGHWPYEDTLRKTPLSEHGQCLHKPAWSPGQRIVTEELDDYSHGGAFLRIKHGMDQEERMYKIKGATSHGQIGYNKIHDSNGDEEWMDSLTDGLDSYHYVSPSSRTDPTKRELKQRLRSSPQSVKKRLGPRVVPRSLPWIKNQLLIKEASEHGGYCNDEGDKSSKPMEPSEDSEEFKQLVDHAFLKYFKLLNENSAERKKYTERVGSNYLKCSVCGSDSKDFTDSLGLVMHAFMTQKGGLRIEHLGLHRALCVLLGWNSAAAPDGIWTRQILTDAEANALREDLIIWPPVVILHHAVNLAQHEREAINGKEFEGFLREKGFISPKTRVLRGKPTDKSVLVVCCQGTLSGLQEADRLHRFYSEHKHGRTEFLQIVSSKTNASKRGGKAPADYMLNSLYGYLGLAEDLDKSDSETKKKSVVRSKKKMQDLAVAQI